MNASGQQIIEDINKAVNSASYVADIAKIDEDHDGFISAEERKNALEGYFFEAKSIVDQTQN